MEADLSVDNSHAVTIKFPIFHMMIWDDLYMQKWQKHILETRAPLWLLLKSKTLGLL